MSNALVFAQGVASVDCKCRVQCCKHDHEEYAVSGSDALLPGDREKVHEKSEPSGTRVRRRS